jgi:hypothetical protein
MFSCDKVGYWLGDECNLQRGILSDLRTTRQSSTDAGKAKAGDVDRQWFRNYDAEWAMTAGDKIGMEQTMLADENSCKSQLEVEPRF